MNINDLKPSDYKVISNPTNINQLAPGSYKPVSSIIDSHNALKVNPTGPTDPNRPLPGSETAVLPAVKAPETGTGLSDLAKTPVNAIGDVLNLIKDSTYGTAKKVLYDIPKTAIESVEEQGLGNTLKNTAKSLPGAVLDVGKSLIPQSAKELANTDALTEIPEQFKELVKENGGSYSKAFQAAVKAVPGSLPDAAVNYASQIDRARESIENHPVNEYLGYLGLKSLGEMKLPKKPDSKVLNTPINEIPGNIADKTKNTVKAIPGSDLPGKAVRRAADFIESRQELNKQPQAVQTAIKAEIPQPQAELIHEANPEEKSAMSEMLEKQQVGAKKLIMKPEERPDAVIGREAMKTVKFLEDQKKSASLEEGQHVKNLSNKPIDFSGTVNDFMDRLATMGVKMGEKGRLDFTKSELSTPASAKDRGLLQLTADELKPDENGEYKKSADELHTVRQRLFNETQNKNFTEPFTDRVVSMVHNDMGTSVRSGLLHDISKQAGDTGKGYESTVTKNASIQDALQSFYKLVGKDTGSRETNIKNLGVGEVANRLEGNASAKVENAFQKIEDTAKKYGYENPISIRKLVAFKSILKNIVGETQHNSLAGATEQGVKSALPDASDVIGNAASGKVVGAAKALMEFAKGNTKSEQVRVLKGLLEGAKKGKSSPSKLIDFSDHPTSTEEDLPF